MRASMCIMTRPDPNERPFLSVDELAGLLGISKGSVYKLVRSGTIPSRRFGKRIVVPTEAIFPAAAQ